MTTIMNVRAKLGWILGLALLSVGAGCVVTSVYPFFREQDLTFEPALVGKWTAKSSADKKEIWEFQKKGAKAYTLVLLGSAEKQEFEARLFKLQEQLFLDLYSGAEKDSYIPPHYLMRVDQIEPSLRVSLFSHDWLKGYLEKDPGAIRHIRIRQEGAETNQYRIALTADTAELQKFVVRHLKTKEAFDSADEMLRQKE